MTESAHTPGKWACKIYTTSDADTAKAIYLGLQPVQALTNDGQRYIMAEGKRVALVDCQTEFKRGKGYQTECAERDANARLIAAAPDLLEACRANMVFLKCLQARPRNSATMQRIGGDTDDFLKLTEAAIARAEGKEAQK